jgi:hypothetical protein
MHNELRESLNKRELKELEEIEKEYRKSKCSKCEWAKRPGIGVYCPFPRCIR